MGRNILSKEIKIERKKFQLELKENKRGKFLRITEDGRGHRNMVIFPSTGLNILQDVLNGMVEANAKDEELHPSKDEKELD